MATTLSNGVVIPDPADLIPGNGVQAFRDQGASVNSALGNRALVGHTHTWGQIEGKPSIFPPAPHTHATGDVDGLDDVLDGKVDGDDSRLSDDRTPLAHSHPVTDVEGLAARLAVLEYRSGVRDVSSLAGADWSEVLASTWRIGAGVNIAVARLVRTTASTGTEILFTLPTGYRPPDTIYVRTYRNVVARILTSGAVQVISPGTNSDSFTLTFDTLQPPAISEPGDPA